MQCFCFPQSVSNRNKSVGLNIQKQGRRAANFCKSGCRSFPAYKSIRIHRSRFADMTLVDSHTSRSFRRHNLGRFAYIEVVSPTIRLMADIRVDSHTQFESIRIQKSYYVSKFEVILYIANITQGAYYARHDFLSEYYSR